MRRRHLLAAIAGGAAGGLAGCATLLTDCSAGPVVDDSVPADRRSFEFLSDENRPADVEPDEPPSVQFDAAASQVVVRGVFLGATPKDEYPDDTIVVDRLAYDDGADTLRVRLVEWPCESGGAPGVGGTHAPYELRVTFPDGLPDEVCAQEGGRRQSVSRTCVSR